MRLKPHEPGINVTTCKHCGKSHKLVSRALNLCIDCIRNEFKAVEPLIHQCHENSRSPYNLPPKPPRSKEGLACRVCVNECKLSEGQTSYCGLRANKANKLNGVTSQRGKVSWYHDPLPTNCVADWVCPGGTGTGYPDFAYSPGPEYGYKNLAVFYEACSFDCLFCQNWHYRLAATRGKWSNPAQLIAAIDDQTACICYFGGDPTPQLPHALYASKQARHKNRNRILRICWETNGSMHPALLKRIIGISLESGGCIKFDLKAWSEAVHIALCGVTNTRTLENFATVAEYIDQRPIPPLLVASTLLIPGYVDEEEVSNIARFIASLNPNIPYTLLAFHPDFLMNDLPTTSWQQANRCLKAALDAGLQRVRVGNVHLLRDDRQYA